MQVTVGLEIMLNTEIIACVQINNSDRSFFLL